MPSRRLTCSCASALCVALAACPSTDSQSSTDTAASTDGTASSTSAGSEATTEEPTTGGPDTGGETTGGPDGAVTRVVYYTSVDDQGNAVASAMRMVEVVGGVAMPPLTILDPPGTRLIITDALHRGPWSPVYSAPEDPAQLWLVDLQAMTPHEVPLPPTIERVDQVRLSRDSTHLIVRVGPTDSTAFEDMTYYTCAIGPQGDCALDLVEPATGPTTYVSWLAEISGASGRIWYETEELDGSASSILQGDIAAPEAAAILGSFQGEPGWIDRISLDESVLYFTNPSGTYLTAIDISLDPPGAPVEIHPPLAGTVHRTWAEDETALLVWNGKGQFGDLHRIAVDGAAAGPMQMVNSGSPGRVTGLGNMWSADGSSILFKSDHETSMLPQLYIADGATPEGSPIRVNPPLAADAQVGTMVSAGDPEHVIYTVYDPSSTEYHRARLDPPGEVHQLSAEGTILSGPLAVSADGARMVHVGYIIEGHNDLFLIDIDGEEPAAPVNLTESLPPEVDVGIFPSLGTNAAEAFVEGHDGDARRLYMVPLSPVGAPVRISDDGEAVYDYQVVRP